MTDAIKDKPASPVVSNIQDAKQETASSSTIAEESVEKPKEALSLKLKTVHESPVPRDLPIEQFDDKSNHTQDREELLDQAITFLETGTVRDAPRDRKQEFLQSKGLTAAEADKLISRVDKSRRKKKGVQARDGSSFVPSTPSPPPHQPSHQSSQPTPTIVTYPEWLAPPPPPGPRPLVTGSTLIKSAYFGAATAATIYGANKLIVTPMIDALTAARLDFSTTVKRNLDELNSRLSELSPSSHVAGLGNASYRARDDDEDSESSEISDPSELFHVDAQTQTTPSLSGHGDDDDQGTGAMTPDSKLEELASQMKVMVETHSDGTDNELIFLLEDLTSYLERLITDSTMSSGLYTGPFGPYANQTEKDKEDPIAKVKQEIRSVKGVLLNTKNFPASR